MAWRAIVDTVPHSESLAELTDFEERLFWRLVSQTDAWGRYYASPAKVRAGCVPLLPVTNEHVAAALEGIVRAGHAELYYVDGRAYLRFVRFDEYQPRDCKRGRRPRFPAPQESPANEHAAQEVEGEKDTTLYERRGDDVAELGSPAQPGVAVGLSAATELSTQTLLAEYIDEARARGCEPPARVKGQLARELKNLIEEGQPGWALRAALRVLLVKALGPSQLASCVQQVQLEQSGAGRRTGAGLSAAEMIRQAEEAARA